jgi:hypothetical protein
MRAGDLKRKRVFKKYQEVVDYIDRYEPTNLNGHYVAGELLKMFQDPTRQHLTSFSIDETGKIIESILYHD